MHSADAYDEHAGYPDELPELPIPRPGEGSERAAASEPIAAPRLGGGASFTSVDSEAASMPLHDPYEVPADADANERFTWEIAARLTAGMLANPARSNSSIKDAMGVFDQFLQEMHAYVRLAADFSSDRGATRTDREAYFRAARERGDEVDTPVAKPLPNTPAPVNRPAPSLPAPASGYQAIPPGSRYVPGSMAGPPPIDPNADRSEDAA